MSRVAAHCNSFFVGPQALGQAGQVWTRTSHLWTAWNIWRQFSNWMKWIYVKQSLEKIDNCSRISKNIYIYIQAFNYSICFGVVLYTHMNIYIYIYMYVYAYIYIYICVCVCVWLDRRSETNTGSSDLMNLVLKVHRCFSQPQMDHRDLDAVQRLQHLWPLLENHNRRLETRLRQIHIYIYIFIHMYLQSWNAGLFCNRLFAKCIYISYKCHQLFGVDSGYKATQELYGIINISNCLNQLVTSAVRWDSEIQKPWK